VLQASALYFDPLDISHMASAMERILTDMPLRQALRRRGLSNVARFSWEDSARRVSQRIDALVQSNAPLDPQTQPAESTSGKL
jgi:glycosyltransferase involved in cell wall biosynthesis